MIQVLMIRLAVNKNIIEENQYKLPQIGSENVIHKALECGWSIC